MLPPSSNLPGSLGRAGLVTLPYLVLLRVGFADPPLSPAALVRSYRTVSPLPRPGTRGADRWRSARPGCGGLLSVALSVPLPGLGVTQHAALVESGLSSPALARGSGHLSDFDDASL